MFVVKIQMELMANTRWKKTIRIDSLFVMLTNLNRWDETLLMLIQTSGHQDRGFIMY